MKLVMILLCIASIVIIIYSIFVNYNLANIIVSILITLVLAYTFVDIYSILKLTGVNSLKGLFNSQDATQILDLIMSGFHLFLIGFLLKSFANLLTNVAHLFFAEIQFESLLVYFKCEGTFTESKISTGTGIHDSTRSENTLIRSSITPWIVVSRIITSTFAATGMKNLEHPRHILEMHKHFYKFFFLDRLIYNTLANTD